MYLLLASTPFSWTFIYKVPVFICKLKRTRWKYCFTRFWCLLRYFSMSHVWPKDKTVVQGSYGVWFSIMCKIYFSIHYRIIPDAVCMLMFLILRMWASSCNTSSRVSPSLFTSVIVVYRKRMYYFTQNVNKCNFSWSEVSKILTCFYSSITFRSEGVEGLEREKALLYKILMLAQKYISAWVKGQFAHKS